MTEDEYRERLRAKGRVAMAERPYVVPPAPNSTSRQKLDHANANFQHRDGFVEPPLTEVEQGMSKANFDSLPPHRKLEIWNRAMAARRAG